jgi:hypothetical protein
MGIPLLSRLRWLRRAAEADSLELGCGGRISLGRDKSGGTTLSVHTAPDETGRCHTATVSLSDAERLELGQALEIETRDQTIPG